MPIKTIENQNILFAFTLIEIIVVMGILVLLSGITFAFYNHYQQEKNLESEVNKIVDVLELAKNKSISFDLSSVPDTCNFKGYQITFINNQTYQLVVCCDIDCNNFFNLNTYRLNPNIIFANFPISPINFTPIFGNTPNNRDIILKHIYLDKCQKINVNQQGIINVSNITC